MTQQQIDRRSSARRLVDRKRRSVALGDTTLQSRFSLAAFVKTFGALAGMKAARAKSVSIRFPNRFVPSEYVSITDITEDWARLPETCRRALQIPGSFVIVQTLQTDSVEYQVQSRVAIDASLRRRIVEEAQLEATLSGAEATVSYESESGYSLTLKGKPMTIAYKPYRLNSARGG
jgi:hypothetical protein